MIAIIGGGAAGMMAALWAAIKNPKNNIKIIERMDRVGKKLLATGNGCCNFTNLNFSANNFHSSDTEAAWRIAKSFPPEPVIEFFEKLGVLSAVGEDGRIYPYSYQASAVLDCLRHALREYNVSVITGIEVFKIKKRNGAFLLTGSDETALTAEKVVIACGGASYKSLGSNGSGFGLLAAQGHSITKISPALAQLKTENEKIKGLDGIKLVAGLSVSCGGKKIFTRRGDVLFTNYGLSGPPVLMASALLHENAGLPLTAHIDFMPDYSEKQVISLLLKRKECLRRLDMENFFTGMLNKRVGILISKLSGIEKLSCLAADLSNAQINRLAEMIKDFQIKITGSKGFETSQVTAGGAVLSEFDPDTLESKITKGLYAAGEVLDVYGDCGGYNLHWAWASGRTAGVDLS